jgi:pimeloyl-ACP methyl ester carboxylesterase
MGHLVFVHGLDNKPEADFLFQLWKRKLAFEDGLDIDACGLSSTMNYWADVLYESPDTNLAAYESAVGSLEGLSGEGAAELNRLDHKDDPRIRSLARKFDVDPDRIEQEQPTDAEVAAVQQERVPVPAWLRKRIMARFVRDAHHYFFNMDFSPRAGATFRVRDELRKRFMKCLGAADGPTVVISHSMGTIIAYDCLKHEPDCPPVEGLMTIGSPLGLDEVQDFFPGWSRADGFPSEKLKGPWVNVFDPLDVVAAADPRIANDYMRSGMPVLEDLREDNWGTWRHSISKYLQGPKLRARLRQMLNVE